MTTVSADGSAIDTGEGLFMTVLFVCTGNTCRSPMAQALFNKAAEKLGISAQAISAGLYADGSPISENSVSALENAGICDFRHISRNVSQHLIDSADIVYGLTVSHRDNLVRMFPKDAHKIRCFPTDISDPFGMSQVYYNNALARIDEGIRIILREISEKRD